MYINNVIYYIGNYSLHYLLIDNVSSSSFSVVVCCFAGTGYYSSCELISVFFFLLMNPDLESRDHYRHFMDEESETEELSNYLRWHG